MSCSSSGDGTDLSSENDAGKSIVMDNASQGIKNIFECHVRFGAPIPSVGALMLGYKKGVRKIPHLALSSGLGLPT